MRAGGGSKGTLSGSMVHVMSNADKTRAVSFSASQNLDLCG